ncbi:hypothetical protein [Streptomyces sp. NPDC046821]|uniref:hypothetical protein n=1 Tax=Streptomyces sp. NPDC046821 TaxID=3154702 RepID=UPI0033EE29DC
MPYGTQHARTCAPELEKALRSGPFHVALRAAITARGLPLHRVRHLLTQHGVSVCVTTLSYWQHGARHPQRAESLRAVCALEAVLELPADSLIRLLSDDLAHDLADIRADLFGEALSVGGIGQGGIGEGGLSADGFGDRPGEHRPAAHSYRSLAEASAVRDRFLTELGAPPDGGLRTVGLHERVRIGVSRELLGLDSQHIVRAHVDGVDRYVAVHHGDPGCRTRHISVRALENCRTGRVRRHRETGVVVAELLFDARLRSGDTFLFRYGFEDGTAGPSSEYLHAFDAAGGQYALQVRFADGKLPARCQRLAQYSPAAPRGGRRDLPLSDLHRSVHLVEPQVRAGIVGIGWDWD